MAPPEPSPSRTAAALTERQALRQRLLAERDRFRSSPQAPASHTALAAHLANLLQALEPDQLGVYWPIRNEFNAIAALEAPDLSKLPLALPWARRQPQEMHYRAWDRRPPRGVDDCGLPAPAEAPAVVPDVVLVPCVGYTRTGFRLGYGGGYFDRWLAQHPGVTAIGIAWSLGEIAEGAFAPQPHDRALAIMLTEHGVA